MNKHSTVKCADRIARFWSHVEKTSGCWLWKKSVSPKGYGYYGWEHRKTRFAHRVSWFLHHGSWPTKLVLHHCDNPRCVRPDHLFEGTAADNTADMLRKARQACGERIPSHKVTADDVRAIRTRLKHGETQAALRVEYGISSAEISRIYTGKRWQHIA